MSQSVKVKSELYLFETEFPAKINVWLNSAKFRTPHLLSKLSNIRPNTIYDLIKGHRSVLKLHPTRIVRIIACLEGLEHKDVLQKYKNVLAEIERICGDTELKVDQELSANNDFTENFTKLMKNQVALSIYTMAVRANGISGAAIKENFGQYGEVILKELIENKIIVKANAHYFPINSEFVRLDRSHVKELIPTLNSFYDVNHAGQDRNFNTMRIDSVNRKTLFEIYDLFATLDNSLTEILSKEESKGDIPFYSFTQFDTMIDKI